MGGSKDADSVRRNADAQTRIAETQAEFANKYFGLADKNAVRQDELFTQLSPFAERLMDIYRPDQKLDLPNRPDMSAQIRKNYGSEVAGVTQDANQALADSEDYATSAGLGRSGFRGMGAGQVAQGKMSGLSNARRALDEGLAGEQLAANEDQWRRFGAERQARNEDIGASLQGANVLSGQQATFSPYPAASVGSGNLGQASGTRSASSAGYTSASTMPTGWSKLGGALGAGLGVVTKPNIWSSITKAKAKD